jgi:hypothetical protein
VSSHFGIASALIALFLLVIYSPDSINQQTFQLHFMRYGTSATCLRFVRRLGIVSMLYSDRLNKDAVRLFLSPQEVCDASVQGYSPGNGRLWLPRVKFELWNAYVYSVNRKSGQEW